MYLKIQKMHIILSIFFVVSLWGCGSDAGISYEEASQSIRPYSPTDVRVEQTSGVNRVAWSAPGDSWKFVIYRRSPTTQDWELVGSVKVADNTSSYQWPDTGDSIRAIAS